MIKPEPVFSPEVARLGRAIRFAFVSFVVALSYLSIRASLAIPAFEQIFRDMLGGKSLPANTVLVIKFQSVLLVGSLLMPLVALGTLFSKRLIGSFYLLGGLCALVFFQFLILYHALSSPLYEIIRLMQGMENSP